MNDTEISSRYKFSIVMAVYNTEEYVHNAIDSLIDQTLDFKDNVQLILVDDGSTDNSLRILNEYKENYPANIIVLHQENCGRAAAINNGLKYVQGKYVNFFDSDDYISSNTLEDVYNFFEKHYDEVDLVSIPITYFERLNHEHMLNYKFESSRVIDLDAEPNNPQLSSASSFFKSAIVNNYSFPSNVIHAEDCILINKLLGEKHRYGVVDSCIYYYRRRFNGDSLIDNTRDNKLFFTNQLKNYYVELIDYYLSKEGEVPLFIQYTLAYDLQWMLKSRELPFESSGELDEFWNYLHYVLDHLSITTIADNDNITNPVFKTFYIYLKYNELHREYRDDTVIIKTGDYTIDNLKNHNLWLDEVTLDEDKLVITGFYNSHFDIDNIGIDAVKESYGGEINIYPGEYVKYYNRVDERFLSRTWQYKHNFEIHIPLKKDDKCNIHIRLTYYDDKNKKNNAKNNTIYTYLSNKFANTAALSDHKRYLIENSHILYFKDNSFNILPRPNEYLLSIILVANNDNNHLTNVMESLLNQTVGFEKIEVIIASNNPIKKLDTQIKLYNEKYGNVNIFTDNMNTLSIGKLRNNGLSYATGSHVLFIDADTTLASNMVEIIEPYLTQDNDVIRVELVYADGITRTQQSDTDKQIPKLSTIIYNKKYLQKNNLTFMEDVYDDELYYTAKTLLTAVKTAKINTNLINSYINNKSYKCTNNLETQLTVFKRLIDLLVSQDTDKLDIMPAYLNNWTDTLLNSQISSTDKRRLILKYIKLVAELKKIDLKTEKIITSIIKLIRYQDNLIQIQSRKTREYIEDNKNKNSALESTNKELLKLQNELITANNKLLQKKEELINTEKKFTKEQEQLLNKNSEKDEKINQLTRQIEDTAIQEQEKDERINELTRQVDDITVQEQEKDKRINELTGQIDDITVQEQEKDKRINELTRQVDIITKQKQEKDEKIGILLEQKEELEKFKKDVYNSTSWKITKPLRKLKFWK
ncbi:glycosyltransferase [Methanosphaera sp.]|jgi:glycosyltransferase involved in cell wall biosynthesis|uniref:glycosyltransferase n=1 Tax=Methanosphaera sp. TaxID=2666342 RepID=UPI003D8F6DB2